MSAADRSIEDILRLSPVMPVVTPRDAASTVALARALHLGGLRSIEITLRNETALEAIAAVVRAVPGLVVGAGTVVHPDQIASVAAAGAAFAVSPGCTASLRAAAREHALPWLPAIATPSELMAAQEMGFRCFKFFPAEAAGGVAMLKALAGPFPQARFCPTGGITAATAPAWLALPNVLCVGGSWLTPTDRVDAGDWPALEALALAAARMRPT
jgi:2-dehydro-3-deoxyphosphogluconate aldolase/(4S)-4-hydroxy-2-oxoglutarate aldolase